LLSSLSIAHFSEAFLETTVETREGTRLANVNYAAPEQRQRDAKVDGRADIFALGLRLNELFTGKIPLGPGSPKIASAAPEYAYLDAVVDQMIQHFLDKRPSDIATVRSMINRSRV
jgi:serine/threonine protein kinase